MSEEKTDIVAGKTTLPANIEELLAREVADISKRIGAPSGDIVKVSQDKKVVFPTGETVNGPFEAVIVDFVAANYMYSGAFNPQNVEAPICFAHNPHPSVLAPSDNSPEKQAETCAVCPNNQFGSGGGNSKACKNTRLLALLPVNADVDTSLMVLKVSPSGIKHFDRYVGHVASLSNPDTGKPLHISQVVTTIGLDPSVTYPSLRFGKPAFNPNWSFFTRQLTRARDRLMTEPDFRPAQAESAPVSAPKRMAARTRR